MVQWDPKISNKRASSVLASWAAKAIFGVTSKLVLSYVYECRNMTTYVTGST